MVNILTATPSQYKVPLFDIGIDYENVSDFDLFMLLCKNIPTEDTSILFGNLDFSKFELTFNHSGIPILFNSESNIVIDDVVYTLITDYVRAIHFIKKKVDRSGNVHTKQYLIDSERRQLERKSKKQQKSMLIPLISAMVNCEQFKYNYDNVWSLPIYVFNDSIQRIQKIKEYDQVMQGIYSGCIDSKKINLENVNWLENLN